MKILDYVLDLLYPPRCMLCRKMLEDDERTFCCSCSMQLLSYLVYAVRRDLKHVKLCVAPFEYRDEVRESLHRYKFDGAAAYGAVYADFIAKSIDENQISCDIISWVPLSRRGLRKRGYDQAEIIARALSDKIGIPCEKLLMKVKNTARQSSIDSREKRKANVAGAYRCVAKEELLAKRVLLVDDIVTSGATLSECARELEKHGCVEVYAAAAASRM